MKKRLAVLITIILLAPLVVRGQESVKIIKSEFKTKEDGFRKAWKYIKKGNKLFESGTGLYPEAAEYYLLAGKYNEKNAGLNYKTAVCFLFGREPLKSLDYFLKAYQLKPAVASDILLLTGRSYHLRADYGKALDCYNMYSDKFLRSGCFDPRVNRFINECNMAIRMSRETISARLENAGMNINSEYDDYSPQLSNGAMLLYFTTRRPLAESKSRQPDDMKWDESIFVATRAGDGWDPAGPAGDNLSTVMNEGVLSVTANGQLMYIYAGHVKNGDIMLAEYKNGKWSKPFKMETKINSRSRESSVSFTAGGNEIFFTSDRKNGFGGSDIYTVKILPGNKWTEPYNLGDAVNSAGNEESVYVSPGGDTIWFSSDRKGGMGGYDIYMAVKDDTGLWPAAVNLGIPFNSQSNDIFYKSFPYNKNEAWLASDRPGGYGGYDVYRVIIPGKPGSSTGIIPGASIVRHVSKPGKTGSPGTFKY